MQEPATMVSNDMWAVKSSTSLSSSLRQLDVRTATSVQTFDFSIIYTSIPRDLLKSNKGTSLMI